MDTSRAAPIVIVAAIDFSDVAPIVVQRALEAARQMNAAQLHFVHVEPGPGDVEMYARRRHELGSWLQTQLAGVGAVPATELLTHEISGEPARRIVELAGTLRASCIVVGARARADGASTLLGAVARAVVCDSDAPVLVVRPLAHSKAFISMVRASMG